MIGPLRFSVGLCGGPALRLLGADSPLRVAAVFERSFYLEARGAFACLGGPRIELGPLNGRLDAPEAVNWPSSGLQVGMRCTRSPHAIHLGGRFAIHLKTARLWRPDAAPERPDPAGVSRTLHRVQAACHRHAALDDLAMAGARHWLAALFEADGPGDARDWLSGLIGLGPGLTPSGDDFIGGIMIALHALGRPEAARRLAGLAVPAAVSASNAISAAHLAAAAEGQGSAAVHRLLNDLLAGDCGEIDPRLAAVGRIGHSSGWDTLAGIVAVLRAWLAAGGAGRRAA